MASALTVPLSCARILTLVWHRQPWDDSPLIRATRSCRDRALYAVSPKPRGLPTMPAGGYLRRTLLALVRTRWPEASPMHRLGRETSRARAVQPDVLGARCTAGCLAPARCARAYGACAAGVARCDASTSTHPSARWHTRSSARCTRPARAESRRAAEPASSSAAPGIRCSRSRSILGAPTRSGSSGVRGRSAGRRPLYAVGGLPRDGALPGAGGYFLHAERLAFASPVGPDGRVRVEPPVELRTHDES